MKITKYIAVFTLCSLFVLQSCKKSDDYYVNPNSPTSAPVNTMNTALQVTTLNAYEGDLARMASILVQQNAGVSNQHGLIQLYNFSDNYFNNSWGQLYQALYTGKTLKETYGAASPYYNGIASVMMAMDWALLTDLWGDIPYSEALQGANALRPKYDSQEDVYKGIMSLLDEALANFATSDDDNAYLPGDDDLFYGGDMAAWTKLAHSLKARYMNRLSKKGTYTSAQILAEVAAGISSSAEDMMAPHGSGNAQNQWYSFQNARKQYVMACETYTNAMSLRNTDLRIYSIFDSTDLGGIVGSPVDPTTTACSQWGPYLAASASTPVPMVTFTEMKFIEAENLLSSSTADAATALNDAIKASCSAITAGAYDGADIAIYTDATVTKEIVISEKWLALFGQVEAYNDYRRTGFPSLTPNPAGVVGSIPARYKYPTDERTGNPNTPTVSITDAVWWAQ